MTDDKVQFVIDAVYAIAHALQVGLNVVDAETTYKQEKWYLKKARNVLIG